MKRIGRMVIVLVGVGVYALGMTMVGSAPAYTQQGPPMFNVNVANPASSPVLVREVDNPVRQPFQIGLEEIEVLTGSFSASREFVVPAGKLLVIEFITARLGIAAGNWALLDVRTDSSSTSPRHTFTPMLQEPFTGTSGLYGVNQPTRLYAGPGSTVVVRLTRTPLIGADTEADVSISGYLVDCGVGSGCPLP